MAEELNCQIELDEKAKECIKKKNAKEQEIRTTLSATRQSNQQEKTQAVKPRELVFLDRPGAVYNLELKLKSIYQQIRECTEQGNPMIYDSCCLNFTTKKCKKNSNHPKDQQVSIAFFFRERSIKTEEQFISEMQKDIKSFPLYHQFTPSVNHLHREDMRSVDPYHNRLE